MTNYTIKTQYLEEEITKFCKTLTNGLGKVDTHFIVDMSVGILKNNSVVLTDISRGFKDKCNLKKDVERLERHIDKYDDIKGIINTNVVNMIKPMINKRNLYFVDGSDIVKDSQTKFENLGYVLDGSDSHKVKTGYAINEIITLDNANQPLPLFSEIMSSKEIEKEYKSTNEMWLRHMQYVSKTYGKGTFICDRGYDSSILMDEIIKNGDNFIIRCKYLNRNVCVGNTTRTISEIAEKFKGFYKYTSKFKGVKMTLKVSSKEIYIKNKSKTLENKPLYLVFVKGYGIDNKTGNETYMVLITNRKLGNKTDIINVVNDYILRWKIEENFKFVKQNYGLENI